MQSPVVYLGWNEKYELIPGYEPDGSELVRCFESDLYIENGEGRALNIAAVIPLPNPAAAPKLLEKLARLTQIQLSNLVADLILAHVQDTTADNPYGKRFLGGDDPPGGLGARVPRNPDLPHPPREGQNREPFPQ
ncbi:MAG: hypothetical protein JST40_08820 [Armatimonadetes bacterium]|nr:hypothetical protein [Armatimonadota bacterium]